MKILWHSVAPWIKTGYGIQTGLFVPRIRELIGHDIAVSSWAARTGIIELHDGYPVYPGIDNDGFGNRIVAHHAKHWGAELVITLADSWVFDPVRMKKIPWVAWTPIDHDPTPPKVVSALKGGYSVPVAYSRFGEDKLTESGLSPLYVPHGCHETFFEKTTKKAARKTLDLPQDAFIVGMVGVNQSAPNRKSYPQALEAFHRFHKRHKDSYLYIHAKENSDMGLNLAPLIDFLKLDRSVIRFPDAYQSVLGHSESYLRDVYTAIDVFLCPNMGEGFGVPIIEAQACGAPIVGTNFSTIPELCFFGELFDGEPYYTTQSSFQQIPRVNDIYRALNRVYNYTTEDYRKGSAHARRSIKKHYHPDMITKKFWKPILEQAKNRIGEWSYDDLESL